MRKAVLLLRRVEAYPLNAGEVACFEESEAARLVRIGAAKWLAPEVVTPELRLAPVSKVPASAPPAPRPLASQSVPTPPASAPPASARGRR
jgi:hypothetical protein